MPVTEATHIKRCKELIEEKLDWSSSREWKQRDYEFLSDLIYEKTNILLSLSTLKRVWSENYSSLPRQSTLDALAIFLGYKSWNDFKKEQIELLNKKESDTLSFESNEDKLHTQKKFRFSGRYAVIVVLIIISLLTFFFVNSNQSINSSQDFDNVLFTSKTAVANGLPNSVIFNYDISSIKSDSVFIQQSWNPKNRVLISKENNYHTSVYYYPGFHKAKLIADGKVVSQQNIHITTDGWLPVVRYSLNDKVPVYLSPIEILNDGKLFIPKNKLEEQQVDVADKDYLLSFYNVKDFGELDGDNFTIVTKLKNNIEEGGLTCQYSYVTVMCENSRLLIPLSAPGCVSGLNMKFPDGWIRGRQNDLSAFGCDLSKWNELKCEIKNKNVKIFLNNEQIYSLAYENPAGKIIGIHYLFFGCGAVDYIKVYDNENKIAFEDTFDKVDSDTVANNTSI